MIRAEKIDFARRIVAAMPLSSEGDALAAGRTLAGLSRWRDTIVADHARDAEELLLAGIIANEQDGDPDDYLGAAAAIREHYAAVTDAEPVEAPAAATIPADATGLKGKRAKIVGTVDGEWIQWGFADGVVVTIGSDGTDRTGYFCCQTDDGYEGWIAASSLALIPELGHGCDGSAYCKAGTHVHGCFADTGNCDDPDDHPALIPDGVVNEGVRCGGRYSDNSRCVLDEGHDSGCRYPFIPEPATLPEPPVGTRLRDKHGDVWVHTARRIPSHWAGPDQNYTWSEMLELGPLHQVWTDGDSVPVGVSVRDALGGLRRWTRDSDRVWTCAESPFTAAAPYGTTEADQ